MIRIALFLAMLLSLPLFTANYAVASEPVPVNAALKKQLLGAPVYIHIFKQELKLDFFSLFFVVFLLIGSYGICDFSGGLGNKRREGDFKSP